MHTTLRPLLEIDRPVTLVVSAGFEARAPRASALLQEFGLRPYSILLLTYDGDTHKASYDALLETCHKLSSRTGSLHECPISDVQKFKRFVHETPQENLIACDITGLSRLAFFTILSEVSRANRACWLLYTEAAEYYPTKEEFSSLLAEDLSEAFFNLVSYEEAEIVYSGKCNVEDVPGFPGSHLPNYPLLLIAFLTFKRSRLSAVLREYEANARILIKGVPVRQDLMWRKHAMEIINFDLIEDNKMSVSEVETLNWKATYDFLSGAYNADHNRYRFNILLAPLGSKMQTVGAWAFAIGNPAVRLVTSTPTRLFPKKYSDGYGQTFLVDDVPQLTASAKKPANSEVRNAGN